MRPAHAFAVALAVSACQVAPAPDAGFMLPPLTSVKTTETETLAPARAIASPPEATSPASPGALAHWVDGGVGAVALGAGEVPLPLAPPGATAPAPGPNRRRLVRFVHLADTQLADDESPTRLLDFDAPGATSGAFRPQEGLQCRVLNAAVRTINALHREAPVDFVLTGGDNADSAQQNEVAWFMAVMNGSAGVTCDSGSRDAAKPAFDAEGLAMPWWWVTGNHDVTVQGNFPVTDGVRAQAVGTAAPTGTRDYGRPGAPSFHGPVVADAERQPLRRRELMTLVAGDGDGHGVGASQVDRGKATYAFDVPGSSLRFIVIDTANEAGSSEGVLHQADVDAVIQPLLDRAKAEGKWVVLSSHHSTTSIDDGSGLGGTKQPDALTREAWVSLLTGYPNVVFSVVGHSHENRVRYVGAAGRGFWEVRSSALSDYPHQLRLIELWDDDNGWLRMHTVMVNWATAGDPAAELGRTLGVIDAVTGWAENGLGQPGDRNVDLFIPRPP